MGLDPKHEFRVTRILLRVNQVQRTIKNIISRNKRKFMSFSKLRGTTNGRDLFEISKKKSRNTIMSNNRTSMLKALMPKRDESLFTNKCTRSYINSSKTDVDHLSATSGGNSSCPLS